MSRKTINTKMPIIFSDNLGSISQKTYFSQHTNYLLDFSSLVWRLHNCILFDNAYFVWNWGPTFPRPSNPYYANALLIKIYTNLNTIFAYFILLLLHFHLITISPLNSGYNHACKNSEYFQQELAISRYFRKSPNMYINHSYPNKEKNLVVICMNRSNCTTRQP